MGLASKSLRQAKLHVSLTDDEYEYFLNNSEPKDVWILRKKFGFFLKDSPNVKYEFIYYPSPYKGKYKFLCFDRLNAASSFLAVINASSHMVKNAYLSYPMYAAFMNLHVSDTNLQHLISWPSYQTLVKGILFDTKVKKPNVRKTVKSLMMGYPVECVNSAVNLIYFIFNSIDQSCNFDKVSDRVILNEIGDSIFNS